jgi:sirohydrochlorin ferrochelatase
VGLVYPARRPQHLARHLVVNSPINTLGLTRRDRRRRPQENELVATSNLGAPEGFETEVTGIVIVDHGSRSAESNRCHEAFVEKWRARGRYPLVEPAHMEMAEPSIRAAFDACVAAGATTVVIAPYFLWPGNHWDRDIPKLAAEASARHPGVRYLVTAPLGPHPLLDDIVEDRIRHCLAQVAGEAPECDLCAGTGRCRLL